MLVHGTCPVIHLLLELPLAGLFAPHRECAMRARDQSVLGTGASIWPRISDASIGRAGIAGSS
jgi:hypothetical protein